MSSGEAQPNPVQRLFKRLTERQAAVLRNTVRYRLATPELFQKRFHPELSLKSVQRDFGVLAGHQLLRSRSLYSRRLYYQLTAPAATALGLGASLGSPPGPDALLRWYGVYLFCMRRKRKRLFPHELDDAFPALSTQGFFKDNRRDYCVEKNEGRHFLTEIFVDRGGDSRRFARKLLTHTRKDRKNEAFSKLYTDGSVAYRVLVSNRGKCNALHHEVRRQKIAFPVLVDVFPELNRMLIN